MADDADIITTAKAHSVKLIPLVDTPDVSYLRTAMASPAAIAAHVAALTDLVVKHGYDGIELDYEHLWQASDRAPYVALINAVADVAARAGQAADAGAAGDGRRPQRRGVRLRADPGQRRRPAPHGLRLPLPRRRPPRADRAEGLGQRRRDARPVARQARQVHARRRQLRHRQRLVHDGEGRGGALQRRHARDDDGPHDCPARSDTRRRGCRRTARPRRATCGSRTWRR